MLYWSKWMMVMMLAVGGVALVGCDDSDAELEVPGGEVEVDTD